MRAASRRRSGGAAPAGTGVDSGAQLVVRIAAALCSTTVITASLGFLFWAAAARLTTPDVVGRAAAVVSSIELIAVFATLGLHTLLIAELPGRRGRDAPSLMVTCFLVVSVVSLCIAICFAIIRHAVDGRESMYGSPAAVALFGTATAVSAVAIVLDGALTGLSRNRVQVLRNLVFAVTKLAALPIGALAVGLSPQLVVLVWVLGNAVSVLVLFNGRPRMVFRRCMSARPGLRGLAPMWRTVAGHHWINVATQAPRLVLPIMVAVQLGDRANAGFYATLLMITFIWIIPSNLGLAMFALSSGRPDQFRAGLDSAIRLSALVSVVAAVAGPLLAEPLLSIFGPAYVDAKYCFTALCVCTFAGAVKSIYIAVRRSDGTIAVAARVALAGAVWELAAAQGGLLLGGVTGLGIALGAAAVVEAALLWPTIARSRRIASAQMSNGSSKHRQPVGFGTPLEEPS